MDIQLIVSFLSRQDDKGRRAVQRAMVVLYNRQTQEEQASDSTHKLNNIGFSGADARLGSYYARWVLSGRDLSGSHLERARKMALKYRRQLLDEAIQKASK